MRKNAKLLASTPQPLAALLRAANAKTSVVNLEIAMRKNAKLLASTPQPLAALLRAANAKTSAVNLEIAMRKNAKLLASTPQLLAALLRAANAKTSANDQPIFVLYTSVEVASLFPFKTKCAHFPAHTTDYWTSGFSTGTFCSP